MFQEALHAAGYGILITDTGLDRPGPIISYVNPAMCSLTGYAADELVGATPRILQGPDTDRAMLDQLKGCLRDGRSFKGDGVNYRKDGSRYIVDWTIDPVLDAAGTPRAWISVQRDVTLRHQRRAALAENEQRLQVLVAELQHRTRNLMGVIRSVADKTAETSADLGDFRTRFDSRLDALARVQGLLSRLNEGERVTVDELIQSELDALDGVAAPVTLEGPQGVRLRSATVQTLAMALHELATNAAKYGALRQPGGTLSIRWRLEPAAAGGAPLLHIDWRERGVTMAPGVAARPSGQGRELIERALPYQLKARTSLVFGEDGVHCTLAIPVPRADQPGA